MGTISDKLVYLNGTKQAIKQAINENFEVIDNNTTFRNYAIGISSNNASYKALIPQNTVNGTNNVDISNSAGLDKALVTLYGNTYQETTTGKNLFDKDNANTINVYVNSTTNKLIPTDSGTGCFYIPCEANTTYTVSKTELFGNDRFCVFDTARIPTAGDTILSFVGTRSGVDTHISYTITTTATATYLGVFVKAGANPNKTMQEIAETIQIEKSSSATSYEKYTGGNPAPNPDYPENITNVTGTSTITIVNSDNSQSQSYTINLGSIELCKIGDYKDRIYSLNGKWYLEKNIGKVVLNGNEEWNSETAYTGYYRYILLTLETLNTNNGLNNRFTQRISQAHGGYEYLFIQANNGAIHIQLLQSRLLSSSITDFKTWLSNNNVTVYYVLVTPATIEITDTTLLNQLNSIKLFEGVNHITFTNESGLDVDFDITYYKDYKLD